MEHFKNTKSTRHTCHCPFYRSDQATLTVWPVSLAVCLCTRCWATSASLVCCVCTHCSGTTIRPSRCSRTSTSTRRSVYLTTLVILCSVHLTTLVILCSVHLTTQLFLCSTIWLVVCKQNPSIEETSLTGVRGSRERVPHLFVQINLLH